MREFWKNEWKLFESEVDGALNFLMQPVTFSGKSKENLMLKPTNEEIVEKCETTGFWRNEWKTFEKEVDSVMNFLMQPVTFK